MYEEEIVKGTKLIKAVKLLKEFAKEDGHNYTVKGIDVSFVTDGSHDEFEYSVTIDGHSYFVKGREVKYVDV